MIETFTFSLRFAGVDQLLAEQAEACTRTKAFNGTQTAITSGTFEKQWGLDATGNWKAFNMEGTEAIERLAKMNAEGGSELLNGTWELNQTRTANKVNEITGITNSVGTAWATPTYDATGNMIGVLNPPATITGMTPAWVPMTEAQWNTLTEAQWSAMTSNTGTTPQQLSARYDAWNRLVLITNGTQKVSEHVYDARGYRIRKDTYTSGTLTEARHYYYTPGWQCVEERVGTSTTLERQFVWGLRYIDDLVLRDRSTANNGVINQRRYAMQDGNWNAIAICDTSGSVGERYAYSAYGTPVFMTGAGVVQTSSPIGFETLYAGYRWDGTTPQMYYVRNRFLLPMIGTWNRRDPLGYVDGMDAYEVVSVIDVTDPLGLGTGKIVGYVVRRVGGVLVKERTLLSKAAAVRCLARGKDVLITSGRSAARNIADKLKGRFGKTAGEILEHQGHNLPGGGIGRPHVQFDKIPGRHIFYAGLATILGNAAAEGGDNCECSEGCSVQIDEIYAYTVERETIFRAWTFGYW